MLKLNRISNRKITLILLITALCASSCKNNNESVENDSLTEKQNIVKEKWHWDNPKKQNEDAGYAQVVKVGNTIYISGVPASDISPEGITQLYSTLEMCLKTYGATFKDVVKETLYTTDIEEMKKYNEVRKKFYQGDYPAATWVQISKLYAPSAKIEVDLIAEIINKNQ